MFNKNFNMIAFHNKMFYNIIYTKVGGNQIMRETIKNIDKKRGITLIALVVTIVIILILAGISIGIVSGDKGVIKQAKEAKEMAEISNEKETIERAVLQTVTASKNSKIEKDSLEKNIEDNSSMKVDITEDEENLIVKVEESGRRYWVDKDDNVEQANLWKDKDESGNTIITDGNINIKVGDYVNYDPVSGTTVLEYTSNQDKNGVKDQVFSSNAETGGWRILDIRYTSKGESIILTSAKSVQTVEQKDFSLQGLIGYSYGVDELNNACEIFGHGEGAESARSISMADINRITGYDPMKTGDGKKYKEGEISEYKNKVKIKKEKDWRWTGTSTNGCVWETTYAFNRLDKNGEWSNMTTTGDSVTCEGTYYYYNPVTLTTSEEGEEKGISSTSTEYKMLFGLYNPYFIATRHCSIGNFVAYGIFHRTKNTKYFDYGGVDTSLTGSGQSAKWHAITVGIKPIVYLSNKATLVQTDEKINGFSKWDISIE